MAGTQKQETRHRSSTRNRRPTLTFFEKKQAHDVCPFGVQEIYNNLDDHVELYLNLLHVRGT